MVAKFYDDVLSYWLIIHRGKVDERR